MALIKDSPVLLMDGSLAELDPAFSIKFMHMIHDLGDKTVLLTANNVNLVDKVCDGVTIIKDGTTLLNESMVSIREKIGRPGVTFKVGMLNLNKFENAMRQQIFVNKVYSKGDSVIVEVDDMLRVPGLIRYASGIAEIFDARQTVTSLEDLYHSFFIQQGL
jgi:ABC-2 type transport system ATP-binding protein